MNKINNEIEGEYDLKGVGVGGHFIKGCLGAIYSSQQSQSGRY